MYKRLEDMTKLDKELWDLEISLKTADEMYLEGKVMKDPVTKKVWEEGYAHSIEILKLKIELLKIKVAIESVQTPKIKKLFG